MLIVGLGNPGSEYENTRHNVGFRAADVLAERFRARFDRSRHRAREASFSFKGESHLLIKPQTYMNLSGESVAAFIAAEQLTPESVLVIVDDINLPSGKIRLRSSGADGGHNGLKSIIGHIGQQFWRLRIGVGMPSGAGLVDHVLGPFTPEEETILARVMADVPELTTMWLIGMGGRAMNRFNAKLYTDPPSPPEQPRETPVKEKN
ncbi:MAG TPA: aminoacyl-tRNA hydrolase [Candidatus Ozemobacteraceae bacterium]|nr:aminoacyl-tRNA hydrolase [Candidatus Ozemobacteraceae bacterium]HQG29427.1 aminoacyl-tRNA hydrolase [Candidatus Ozemobacteraceae bacterium]